MLYDNLKEFSTSTITIIMFFYLHNKTNLMFTNLSDSV